MTSRILVFCDDLYHPAATVRTGLAALARGGFEFDWVENATGWKPENLKRYRVALLSKSNVLAQQDRTPWLVGRDQEIFRDFVRAGGGLVAVHSGTASYKDVPAVRDVLGGVFVSHPLPCPVTVEPAAGHRLTQGVDAPFVIHDEHYQMIVDDSRADVFLHAASSHGRQPAGWTRRDGAGHVCVLTPGHFPEVWLHPSFQILLRNALAYAGSGDS